MGEVRCLVGWEALLVGFLGGSFLTVDVSRVMKKIRRVQVLVCK